MGMCVLFARMFVHHINTSFPWRPEQVARSPGTGITNGCELPCRCWESKRVPLEGTLNLQAISLVSNYCVSKRFEIIIFSGYISN